MTATDSATTSTYAGARRIFDADSHLMESPDWLAQYVAPKMRGRFPALDFDGLGELGRSAKATFASIEARRSDPGTISDLEANVMAGAKGWEALGAFESSERSRALDLLGFERQLVFPTFATLQYLTSGDVEVVYEGARAQNVGVIEFCNDDDRLLPVAFVPLKDLERAERLIDDAVARGAAAFWATTGPPGGMSPAHPDVDGVWARLSDAGVPLVLHVGGGRETLPSAFHDNGRPLPTDHIGGGENLRAKDYPQMHHRAANFLSCMILDGVFERFPGLRAGVIELGASWVPGWLQSLDHAATAFSRTEPLLEELSLTPTEYAQRQIRFTPFAFEDTGSIIEQAGADLFMFSTDYPHPEGTRNPLERFDASLANRDVDSDAVERFMWGNFADLVGISKG